MDILFIYQVVVSAMFMSYEETYTKEEVGGAEQTGQKVCKKRQSVIPRREKVVAREQKVVGVCIEQKGGDKKGDARTQSGEKDGGYRRYDGRK